MTTKLLGTPLEYFLQTTLVKVVAEVTLQANMTFCPNCALYVNAGKMMLGRLCTVNVVEDLDPLPTLLAAEQ